MKTVCKKLLSLMLVAVLLVSAVPMMASADSPNPSINVTVKKGTAEKSENVVSWTTEYVPNETTVRGIVEASKAQYEGKVGSNFVTATVKVSGTGQPISFDDWIPEHASDIWVVFDEPAAVQPPEEPTEAVVAPISITVKVNNSDNVVWTGSKTPANKEYALVKDLLSYVWSSDWDNAYTFHHAWVSERQTNLGQNDKVYAGETLYVALENKTTSGSGGSGSGSGSDSGSSSKFPYSVYLHIYAKGNVATPLKSVTLDTWSCVKDGVVTLDEVKEVVKTYYTAKTSDGIGYDGFYYSTSTTKNDYINNENKTTRINNLDDLRTQGYVHLNVWIDNYVAKSSSSSNADTSNPKTGDSIYTAVAVMGLSVTALAAVYFINKKRIAY